MALSIYTKRTPMPEHAFIWSSWHQDTILLLSHTHCNGWTNEQPDKAQCWALLAQSEPARSWHRLLPNGRTSAASWRHSPLLQNDNKCQTQKIRHKACCITPWPVFWSCHATPLTSICMCEIHSIHVTKFQSTLLQDNNIVCTKNMCLFIHLFITWLCHVSSY